MRDNNTTKTLADLFIAMDSQKDFVQASVELIKNNWGYSCVGIRVLDKDESFFESYLGFIKGFQNREEDSWDNSFNSTAIVDIPFNNKKLGEIYLADQRKDIFTPQKIELMEELAVLIGKALSRYSKEDDFCKEHDTQVVINSLLHISLGNKTEEEILQQAIELIFSVPWSTFQAKGGIYLVEEDPQTKESALILKSLYDKDRENMCRKVPLGICLCGRAASTGKTQYANYIDERHDIILKGVSPHGHLCVPIKKDNKVLGIINICLKEGHRRDKKEEELLEYVAKTIASILELKQAEKELRLCEIKRESYEKLRDALTKTIEAMALTVELRDPYTAGHQRRVTKLAQLIGKEIGLPQEKIDGLFLAASIHDIGKIYVPAEILSKPGKINNIEFELIKIHSQVGYDILKGIEFPWPIAKIVMQHHERIDGSGYPQGLLGNDILIESRIISIADVVEAMSSHRPYRPSLGINMALEEILKNKGRLYDPDVVDACVKVVKENKSLFL